ncbi:hypothetical protein EGH24_00115 [Halonotius terrestris]|uniref:Uncharacterized protein n=1 Tax=Halonotius terrestris TaxID=2487750 RepID=A0A8J8P901_9EURY|nr:hypothetical protein [Halonotius terrestris]TQQ83248.1 hypothetical protein EGH24_00115 [Halonotius terrestris]
MNRRNFILGLGTAATLSGAASVTSAALQGDVEAGADFRILSAEQLNVARNPAVETGDGTSVDNSLTGYVNESNDFVDNEGSLNFTSSTLNESDGPNITVDDQNNSELNMSLATINDNSTAGNRNVSLGGSPPYNGSGTATGTAPLIVDNVGASDADVGVEYNYGADVESGDVSESLVRQLYTFSIDTTQISPDDGSAPDSANYVTVGAGNTVEVDVDINYNKDIEQTLRQNLSSGFGASSDNLDLLDSVFFGVQDN